MKTVTPLTLLCLCDTLLKKPNEAQVTSGGGRPGRLSRAVTSHPPVDSLWFLFIATALTNAEAQGKKRLIVFPCLCFGCCHVRCRVIAHAASPRPVLTLGLPWGGALPVTLGTSVVHRLKLFIRCLF